MYGTVRYLSRGPVSMRARAASSRARRDDTRERVLSAGFEVFSEFGFDGASTLEIATRAKVSKRELYALFDDKQAIVLECIKWRTKQMQLPLELPRPSDVPMLATTLGRFGTVLLTGVCDPAVLAALRLAIAEAQRAPEIAKVLNERGREPSRRIFLDLVEKAQEDGLLRAAPPAEISEFFFSMLWGDLLIRLLLGAAKLPTKSELEERARHASDRVMAAYAGPKKPR